MSHHYVPPFITEVTLSPIIKSSLKNPCDSSNYRPIAIATSASQLLEMLLLNRLEPFLGTTDNQFGSKKGHGTDTCIYVLKDILNYYRQLQTPIFVCFIDIKSAFDKISYKKLFCTLCDRKVPKYLILLLNNWYVLQKLCVRWGGINSCGFGMKNGIRQRPCLSPHLFSVYVDSLSTKLNSSRVGCHVAGKGIN